MTHEREEAQRQLLEFKARADARLQRHGQAWVGRSLPGNRQPTPAEVVQAILELTLRGGKRVRPALAYAAANCFDHGLAEESLLDAVLSVEILQTYLLIHDDLMDQDAQRRGGPSMHVLLTSQTGEEALGEALAILAGDLACGLAQELLVTAGLPPDRAMAGVKELTRMQWEVIQGQHLDLLGGAPPAAIHDAKTASYTTRGPVRLGGALAGASSEALEQLERFGTPLGRAFQIRDDLLGVFGSARATGKPVGADLKAGKRTELIEHALAEGSPEQQRRVREVLGHQDATEAQLAAACEAIEACGAREQSENLVQELTTEALRALEDVSWCSSGRAFLRGIALLLAHRDR